MDAGHTSNSGLRTGTRPSVVSPLVDRRPPCLHGSLRLSAGSDPALAERQRPKETRKVSRRRSIRHALMPHDETNRVVPIVKKHDEVGAQRDGPSEGLRQIRLVDGRSGEDGRNNQGDLTVMLCLGFFDDQVVLTC